MDARAETSASDAISTRLLAWYDVHARRLPWRTVPGAAAPDAYRVWLSEVMLQQTTVAAVGPYFERFIQRWPTVRDLAAADDADVMSAWAGLGYYARARNLLACARAVAAGGGTFPDTEEGLRRLPGLGAYTAAAVAAIAFGRRAVVVDANVERVVSRLFALAEPLPGVRPAIRAATDAITPDARAGDFAQAMMDLGATVCTPRGPRCLLCPLAGDCAAGQTGDAERYPVKAAKRARPERRGRAFALLRDGCVWLVRRPGKGMLGGMRALPDDGWSARGDGDGESPWVAPWQPMGAVQHVFTHFALHLSVSATDAGGIEPAGEGEWWPLDRLDDAGLPTLFAKAARLIVAQAPNEGQERMTLDRRWPLDRRALLRGSAFAGAAAVASSLPWGMERAWAATAVNATEARWPKVTGLLDSYVGQGRLAGAVAAFGWGDGPLGTIARGNEGFDDGDAAGADSLYRVYSMTKPVTGMAAMMLIDEGKLGLDQPLADFAPEFANPRVATDPARSLDARPAQGQITIRHLLTHTAGLGYAGITRNKVGDELLRLGVTPAVVSRMPIPGVTSAVPTPDPDTFLRLAASVPLLADPGTKWRYSMGLDVLGIVVQRASGASSFAAFLDERLFGPAGMSRSFFRVPDDATGHLTTNYGVLAGIPMPIDKPDTSIYRDPPPFAFGGAGLVTTPADYDRFLQLLVGGGRIGGRQVLSERAVRLGMSNLLPPGADTSGTVVAGSGFGAGGMVGLGADAGTFGWSGAAGTVGLVAARIGLRAGLYVQFMPSETWPIQREFRDAARADAMGSAKP